MGEKDVLGQRDRMKLILCESLFLTTTDTLDTRDDVGKYGYVEISVSPI